MTITVDEAASRLGRSGARVRKLLAEGYLNGEKAGRDWVVDEVSVEAYKLSVVAPLTPAQRGAIIGRDRFVCQDCGYLGDTQYRQRKLHVHHLVERDKGGTNDASNLITLCWLCHLARHPKDRRAYIGKSIWVKAETVEKIAKLMEKWECTEGEVIERVIANEPIPPRAGMVRAPRMVEGQTHWEIQGVGKAGPTEDPNEFKVVPFDDV